MLNGVGDTNIQSISPSSVCRGQTSKLSRATIETVTSVYPSSFVVALISAVPISQDAIWFQMVMLHGFVRSYKVTGIWRHPRGSPCVTHIFLPDPIILMQFHILLLLSVNYHLQSSGHTAHRPVPRHKEPSVMATAITSSSRETLFYPLLSMHHF